MDKQKFIEVLQIGSEEEVVKFINTDESFQIFKTHYFNFFDFNNNSELIDLNELAKGILAECNELGIQQLVDKFYKFLKLESISGVLVLAISGIIVNQIIELDSNLKLVPLSFLPDSVTRKLIVPDIDNFKEKLRLLGSKTKTSFKKNIKSQI